jgi:two-component system, sensor histidine kinase and response regulator
LPSSGQYLHESGRTQAPSAAGLRGPAPVRSPEPLDERSDTQEARLRAVVDAAHDAFVVIDEQSRVQDWNPAAERLFGWSRDEILGKRITETIIPPRFRRPHIQGMENFLSTGDAPVAERRLEVPAQTRDGREVPVEVSVSALLEGSHYAFAAFIRDVSERREAELEGTRERVRSLSLPRDFWEGEASS